MPTPQTEPHLAALARHMTERREAVLSAWRAAVFADPTLTTGASLPKAQINDHIPALLQAFESRLASNDALAPLHPQSTPQADAAAHGLHRWQQGFDLAEVARELGRLNECVVSELDAYDAAQSQLARPVMARARALWAQIYSLAISASTAQFFKLQQIESASHVRELEAALQALRELEHTRAELWQQAAHDLRGNLGVVANATAGLGVVSASDAARAQFLALLGRNVKALHHLLDDVTSLARLQGGQETLHVQNVDAAALLAELGESLRAQAVQRGLQFQLSGPVALWVQGDAVKIRRIAQNLVINAIKYTTEGGIHVSWGDAGPQDSARWMLQVQDSGPGLHPPQSAELVNALEVASEQSAQVAQDARSGTVSHAGMEVSDLHNAAQAPSVLGPQNMPGMPGTPGEGIGLSIVKRLCELLNATPHVDTDAGLGTTFRILLPRAYAS